MLSPKHMSVQNGAIDVRQSDATGRMRLTSVFSPAHVCVHSTTQARSQDFPRGGSYSGEKWTLSLKPNVDLCTVPYEAFDPRGGGSSDPQTPPPLATGLRRESISRRTAEMETPDRPVASHPGGGGGGGSELGWVEHYRSIQGMVGLSIGSWQKQGVWLQSPWMVNKS